MTRSRDVSAVQNNLGVAIPPAAAGKNAVINGGMDIWQRGTSFSIAASTTAYTADRLSVQTGTGAGTISRQATGDTTNLPIIQYCARIQRNSGQTGTSTYYIAYNLETVDSYRFAGQTVTLSFYARRGANYSATSNALNVYLISGTGTDQNLNVGGFTGAAYPVNNGIATLTTTWQRFTFTGTVAASATQLGMQLQFTPTGTAGAADYFEVTGVQLELGSSATPFSRNGSSIQGELAACQRYYYRSTPGTTFGTVGYGLAVSTTVARMATELPVEMRVRPTSVEYGNLRLSDREAVNSAVSALTLATNDTSTKIAATDVTSSSLTQWRFTYLTNNNNTAGYLGFSAEL